jgi:hypothetical protein
MKTPNKNNEVPQVAAPASKARTAPARRRTVAKPQAPVVKPAPASVAPPAAVQAAPVLVAAVEAAVAPAVAAAPAKSRPVAKPQAKAKPLVVETPAEVSEAKTKKKPAGKKSKLVRDSFTIPDSEYQQIAALKQRALEAGHEVKKSELLRAGLAVLSAQSTPQFLEALSRLEKLKTGRPAK